MGQNCRAVNACKPAVARIGYVGLSQSCTVIFFVKTYEYSTHLFTGCTIALILGSTAKMPAVVFTHIVYLPLIDVFYF